MKFALRARPARSLGGDAVALMAGAASVLAFAPFHVWLLAVICPALLFALWAGGDARLAARRGFFYGTAEFLAGIYWIYIAVSGLGPAPWWLGVLFYILLSCACAAFPAIIGYVTKRLAPHPGALWLLLVPSLWALSEWVRSFIFTGFPWLALGYSQSDHLLGGYLPVFGLFGASFACVAVAVLIVLALRAGQPPVPRAAAIAGIAVALATGGVLGGIVWTHPSGPPLKVALVQGNIPQKEKWTNPAVQLSFDRYTGMTRRIASADLLVWPEAAIPAWYSQVAPELDKFGTYLRRHNQSVVYGVLIYDWRKEIGYNGVVAMGAGVGTSDNVYYKRHLVPFGEYFPVPGWIKHWLSRHALPHSSFTPGPLDQPPLAVKHWRIAVANCYEIAFGRLLRYQLPLANFIINVSDDGWFGHSIASAQQFEMARTAARETGRFVLVDANSGVTGVIGPGGRVLGMLPRFRRDVLSATIRPYIGATPYVSWGNSVIVILCCILLLLSSFILYYGKRKNAGR